MITFSQIPGLAWRLLLAAALVAVVLMTQARAAECDCAVDVTTPQATSWIFARSRYSHDPDTGGRVAQYARKPPVEALPDPRGVTSGYSRTRNVLRGADGSTKTYYQVQSYGNGRGGIDAEWERFHDAWRGSRISGGSYEGTPPFGFGPGFGFGGFPGYGWGGFYPGYGNGSAGDTFRGGGPAIAPDSAYGPGYGRPDPGFLDPDATDGYRDPRPRTRDRQFYRNGREIYERSYRPGDDRHDDDYES